ncbi:hypothetical protein LEP1GSC071_0406 [Leptospira santarosai str. JET]|nr:hypothetical protein LEP1GSC071_0406 [Leptospira santarosai str. JET]
MAIVFGTCALCFLICGTNRIHEKNGMRLEVGFVCCFSVK